MELTTILGIIVGVIAVVFAMIFKHISFSVFINPAALFVIFVGTAASILNAFTGRELKTLGKLFGLLFSARKSNSLEIVRTFSDIAQAVRKDGVLAIEPRIAEIGDPFMKKGLQMVVDGAKGEFIQEVLSSEIDEMEERHSVNASIFSQAGSYAPTLGVLGAVFGLIAAMSNIDNTELMAEAVAAAFIATILGIFTGYVLWNPFANKLKMKSKQEAGEKRIIIEGILSLQNGESPQIVMDRLKAMLPLSHQEILNRESEAAA
ncbi:MAG: flagellar motor stator protein MotA [Clostridiales bacterium]|jgi:chemotaxis protein MotA|nr:flagellar motor stator protein MotA [Clostridiales bacterium]